MNVPELHPLNDGFTWAPATGPWRRIRAEQAQSYDERGFLVLEDAFDAGTMARLIAEIDPHEDRVERMLQAQEGGRFFIARAGQITFTTHLVTRSPSLRDFAASQVFQDLAHDLIGDDVRLYWDQAVYKKPETNADFPWHQDNGYTFVRPQQYLTCWLALTDATEENGCPWVVPGMHRKGTLKHWMTDLGWRCFEDVPGAIAVPVRAGSIVIFSSLTPHRTGPNLTSTVRKAWILQYAPCGAKMILGENLVACEDPGRQFLVLSAGQAPG